MLVELALSRTRVSDDSVQHTTALRNLSVCVGRRERKRKRGREGRGREGRGMGVGEKGETDSEYYWQILAVRGTLVTRKLVAKLKQRHPTLTVTI